MTELTDVARVKWIQEPPDDDEPLVGGDVSQFCGDIGILLNFQAGFQAFRPTATGIYGKAANIREQLQHP